VEEMVADGPIVVFCVTSLGRTWQLKLTLPQNIVITLPFRKRIRWCIVDLNPEADVDIGKFVCEHFQVAEDHIAVYKAPATEWHASKAKNTSHKLAHQFVHKTLGESAAKDCVCVNVDGDNILTPEFCRDILRRAERMVMRPAPGSDDMFWPLLSGLRYSRSGCPGITGRVAIPWCVFVHINGYDEDLLPSGYQDLDIYRRASHVSRGEEVKAGFAGCTLSNVEGNPVPSFAESCSAKLRNVDASSFPGANPWTKMNNESRQTCQRPSHGMVCNTGKSVDELGVSYDTICQYDIG
jgi:hypothetical protein